MELYYYRINRERHLVDLAARDEGGVIHPPKTLCGQTVEPTAIEAFDRIYDPADASERAAMEVTCPRCRDKITGQEAHSSGGECVFDGLV